jgi:hypothetical protein
MNSNATVTNFLWSNGTFTATATNLSAGNFSVQITFGNNCTIIDSFTLVAPPVLQISANILHETAPSNGAIDLSVSGGVAPYIYSWSNNAQNEDLQNLDAGWYDIQVADANGCSILASYEVLNQITAEAVQIEEAFVVSLFPNPNTGNFTLELPQLGSFEISILDIQGRLIYKNEASGITQINQGLSSGKYLCWLTNVSNGKTIKVPFVVL